MTCVCGSNERNDGARASLPEVSFRPHFRHVVRGGLVVVIGRLPGDIDASAGVVAVAIRFAVFGQLVGDGSQVATCAE